ncbi:MAG: ABC transporter permease, partial [Planctomycetales bacterium]|nr:ABC transporter permease [Planctomycetales bacterium]NIM09658.1 ABC transporter permease [Planctomycetales bacterium]NIN09141.1 ABC transporter permease [Planctomycetales bacterium]NIN78248.1 ABC transporter permease [Planctomycetales bacterium]NIO35439.1 ABC transporter permease [Planctomycetales bacterium]
ICISYKVMYDARESANAYVVWQDCHHETVRMVPGLVLAFMETIVLAAISVAISTRLSMLANLTICTAIYVVGHLLPLLVQSGVGEFAIVEFMGQLFATILPVLEHFNIYGAVAAGKEVPLSYLGWVGVYTLVYVTIAMLLALALFDDRDLA